MDIHFYIRILIIVVFSLSIIFGLINLILKCIKKNKYNDDMRKQESGQY